MPIETQSLQTYWARKAIASQLHTYLAQVGTSKLKGVVLKRIINQAMQLCPVPAAVQPLHRRTVR